MLGNITNRTGNRGNARIAIGQGFGQGLYFGDFAGGGVQSVDGFVDHGNIVSGGMDHRFGEAACLLGILSDLTDRDGDLLHAGGHGGGGAALLIGSGTGLFCRADQLVGDIHQTGAGALNLVDQTAH